jgi:class 3 adenylate cyclase/tetratricopeptide (TPR) repeat protein
VPNVDAAKSARVNSGDAAEMSCPHCGSENPAGEKFCGDCGGALENRCPQCGAENPANKKFCGDCGVSLAHPSSVAAGFKPASGGVKHGAAEPAGLKPAATKESQSARAYTPRHLAEKILNSRSALEGERKQVTVLFADVKGSMELAEQLDPEAFSQIMQRFFRILSDGVERFEGFVDKFTGDGIMALFGAPIAHEDHAQRACLAALHLRDEIARYATELKREHGIGFSTRMGLNSGEVIVGKIGDDLRMDYTAQGHTVGLAQRMESLAEPNTCYLSAATAALAAGYFALDDLGEFRVKGVAAPMRVHRLDGLGGARTRFDVARSRGLSRFVGRASDLRTLEDALEQTAAGNGQVIGVVAEAGTGKSRLCFEFLEHCRERGMRVFEGRAVAHGRNVPFLPILEVFRSYFGITGEDDDNAARAKIAAHMNAFDQKFGEALPLVFDFLGVSDPQNPAPRLDPDLRQRQLIGVMRHIIRSASEKQPTVTMVEDLHWLDAASAEFLEHMVDARAGTHSLLLLNFRPEYRAEWMQKSWYRQIPLTPLDQKACGELLASLLGNDPSIATLAAPIHARTGGNPFFIEEVAQHLIETGHLAGGRGAYRFVTPLDRMEVPATVKSVLAARIDRLAEREKRLLQTAAVIGKDFAEPLLAAVAELASVDLTAALTTLQRAEFLHEQAIYPVAEYAFKHPLTQEVALGSLLQERCRHVHASVARAIEQQDAAHLDERAALLAHHWEEAGEAWPAALWHKRAAEWAGTTNAAEGVRHWERVRSLVRTLPHTGETVQLGVTACLGNLILGWRLGTPADEAVGIFEEGRRLAEEGGDVRALAALHGTYACVLGLVGGDSDEYVRYSREATRLADQTDDLGLQLAERSFLAFGCVFAGRLAEGLEACDAACQRLPADPALGAEFTGYSPFLGLLCAQAWMLCRLGRLNEATAACDRVEELARAHGDSEVLTWLQLPRIELDVSCADAAAARDHARSALQTGEKSATPQARTVGLIVLGVAHRLNSQWDESVVVLEEAVHATISGSNRQFEGWVRAALAEALLGRGELDRAEHEAQLAVTVAHAQHSRCDEIRAHLALAHTQLRRANAAALARAEQALVRAQELIDETSAQAYQPEVHECRAYLARLRGDALTAQREFKEARRLYAEMGATAQAERLATELGS